MEGESNGLKPTIYLKPQSVSEAVKLAVESMHDFKFIAGATDYAVNSYQENVSTSCLIDLTEIHEMDGVSVVGDHVNIGSQVKLDKLIQYEVLAENFPALIRAAESVGSPLIRKSATLGGNVLCENRCIYYNQSAFWRDAVGYCLKCEGDICIATGSKKACYSEFVSDTAPVLISLGAKIELIGSNGKRTIALEDIYTGDGVEPRNLDKTEILTHFLVPLGDQVTYFRKLRSRESLDFTSLTVAITKTNSSTIRIVMAGVDPKPVIVAGNMDTALEEWIKMALRGARAIDNDMMTRKYRREMIKVFITEGIEELFDNTIN